MFPPFFYLFTGDVLNVLVPESMPAVLPEDLASTAVNANMPHRHQSQEVQCLLQTSEPGKAFHQQHWISTCSFQTHGQGMHSGVAPFTQASWLTSSAAILWCIRGMHMPTQLAFLVHPMHRQTRCRHQQLVTRSFTHQRGLRCVQVHVQVLEKAGECPLVLHRIHVLAHHRFKVAAVVAHLFLGNQLQIGSATPFGISEHFPPCHCRHRLQRRGTSMFLNFPLLSLDIGQPQGDPSLAVAGAAPKMAYLPEVQLLSSKPPWTDEVVHIERESLGVVRGANGEGSFIRTIFPGSKFALTLPGSQSSPGWSRWSGEDILVPWSHPGSWLRLPPSPSGGRCQKLSGRRCCRSNPPLSKFPEVSKADHSFRALHQINLAQVSPCHCRQLVAELLMPLPFPYFAGEVR